MEIIHSIQLVVCLWKSFPTQDNFVPQGMFGNVWRNLGLSQLGGRGATACIACRPAMLLSILQCTGQIHKTKNDPAQGAIGLKLKNPGIRECLPED